MLSLLEPSRVFCFALAVFSACYAYYPYLISSFSQFAISRTGKRELHRKAVVPQPNNIDPQIKLYKRLYHQLHNLERYPEVISESRDVLLSLFSEAIATAQRKDSDGILDITAFDETALRTFLRREDTKITAKLEDYVERRANGEKRQLFQTFEQARDWLIRKAPSKLVDGAWLGHIHKVSTPFELRHITKNAWQVMSEELGDGDVTKHHAAIYRELLQKIGGVTVIPEADSADFVAVADDLGISDVNDWKGAVTQLLISLFPGEFLPEILGFNMHFECLTWDTLLAARELKELGIDNNYFLLHISIDNPDSGHTAMAAQIVIDYLRHVELTQKSAVAVQQAWRGVQVGYLLSAMFITDSGSGSSSTDNDDYQNLNVYNPYADDLIKMLASKSVASAKLHCTSRARIGGKRLSDWLGELAAEQENQGQGQQHKQQRENSFLTALSQSKPWINPGRSSAHSSKLVRELEWGGKMFGAFTNNELQLLKNWIENLTTTTTTTIPISGYWEFVGKQELVRPSDAVLPGGAAGTAAGILDGWPVMSKRGLSRPWWANTSPDDDNTTAVTSLTMKEQQQQQQQQLWNIGSKHKRVDVAKLLPLWFAHPCLLESFISIPIRTRTEGGAAVIRALRAQRGFLSSEEEGSGVSGMDEVRRTDSVSLVDIGLEMTTTTARRGRAVEGTTTTNTIAIPKTLREVILPTTTGEGGQGQNDSDDAAAENFALDMLHWSERPLQHRNALLGMAWAFARLHEEIANSPGYRLISERSMEVLGEMARREIEALTCCRAEWLVGGDDCTEFEAAAAFVVARIKECFY